MAICELPGMLCTSKELTTIEKTPLMSRKILTHNPGFLCLPTDLVTKHCHIKWWCLGKNFAHTPCTPCPRLRWGCLSEMMGSAWVKAGWLQRAFQILKRTKHFGINTMYSLLSQIYKIYISSFLLSFSFYI